MSLIRPNCLSLDTFQSIPQIHAMADTVSHNYHPPWVKLPHFVPNEDSVVSLIARFGALWVAVSIGATFLIRRLEPKASLADRVAFVWMCLS
jgi:cholestenol delta-isomerase